MVPVRGDPAGLKGKPVGIRNCARSCVIRNSLESDAIGVFLTLRRPGLGEVRRPAVIKFDRGARGQVPAKRIG